MSTRSLKEKKTLPQLKVRHSRIQGRGVFTLEPIVKGARIIEYTGERISQKEADARYDDEAMARHHTFLFEVSRQTVIDGRTHGNEARFINHSCDPNCEAVIDRSRVFIEAMRNIPAGAELFFDYGYNLDPDGDDAQTYPCSCGSTKCRGTILKKWT